MYCVGKLYVQFKTAEAAAAALSMDGDAPGLVCLKLMSIGLVTGSAVDGKTVALRQSRVTIDEEGKLVEPVKPVEVPIVHCYQHCT